MKTKRFCGCFMCKGILNLLTLVFFFLVSPAHQMLLLCQGVNGMRKEGDSVVWSHHKQGFQGESLTVNVPTSPRDLSQNFSDQNQSPGFSFSQNRTAHFSVSSCLFFFSF